MSEGHMGKRSARADRRNVHLAKSMNGHGLSGLTVQRDAGLRPSWRVPPDTTGGPEDTPELPRELIRNSY
jgi:hypothetical protein